MKSLKIGVCGVGNVGGAVIENLIHSPMLILFTITWLLFSKWDFVKYTSVAHTTASSQL